MEETHLQIFHSVNRFFRFVDHILDEAFCVVADGLPVNVFHVWRIEVGATEYIRQIFFFCDRSE